LPSEVSLLAHPIEIGVATATNVDDGGQVSREVLCVSTFITQREAERDSERELRLADERASAPGLPENVDLSTGVHRIKEGLAVRRRS
jgi:hypothetical protein